MTRISLDTEEVAQAAGDVEVASGEAEQAIATLTSKLAVLDAMEGQWKSGFSALYDDQYTPQAQSLVETLDGLNQWLKGVAQSFGEVDGSFAG